MPWTIGLYPRIYSNARQCMIGSKTRVRNAHSSPYLNCSISSAVSSPSSGPRKSISKSSKSPTPSLSPDLEDPILCKNDERRRRSRRVKSPSRKVGTRMKPQKNVVPEKQGKGKQTQGEIGGVKGVEDLLSSLGHREDTRDRCRSHRGAL